MAEIKVKGILFDLGETLLNFGVVDLHSLFRQGAKLSYDYLKSCGQPTKSFNYYLWKNLIALRLSAYRSKITNNDFDSLALLKKLGKKEGVKLDDDQWEHFVWLWYEPLSRVHKPEPDIVQTLDKLKNMGLKLGILSNTFVHACALEKDLRQLGILDFFETRLYSYQFKIRKPNPKIFIAATEKLGLPPQQILYVGDRIDKDIKPTLKLNMTAILKTAYTNKGKKLPQGAQKITNISELPSLIEKINAQPLTAK